MANDVLNDRPFLSSETAAAIGRLGAAATNAKRRAEKERKDPTPPDVRFIRARMDQIERLMRKDPTSKVLDELTRSYERLFKVWQVLAGLPGPGQRRPGPEKEKRRRIEVEPERAKAQPEDVPPELDPVANSPQDIDPQ